MQKDKTITFDFDGVIHRYGKGYFNGTVYDEPMDKARESMEQLVEKGYYIVICSARLNPKFKKINLKRKYSPLEDIEEWLKRWGFKKGTSYHLITNNKYPSRFYIDDRGIRFINWEDVMNYF